MFSNLLSREYLLSDFSEGDFVQVMKELWANFWAKKEAPARKVLSAISIEELRKNLFDLIWGDDPLHKRYDRFRRKVKYMGSAQITEILSFINPKKYAIWNRRSRAALNLLGFGKILPLNKWDISGSEYERINEVVGEIAGLLRDERHLPEPDMIYADIFLYYIDIKRPSTPSKAEADIEFDHEEVKDMLVQIGSGWGFDVDKEVPITAGCQVDVVWSARIGNLGEVKYVFEVHKSGSIDSLLLNLLRSSNDPTVQKVVAVSTKENLEKIKREAVSIPGLAGKIVYWDVREVIEAANLLDRLNSIMRGLELVRS